MCTWEDFPYFCLLQVGAFALWPWFCDERLGKQPLQCRKRFAFDLCGSQGVCGWHLAEVQWRTDRGQLEWDCQSAPVHQICSEGGVSHLTALSVCLYPRREEHRDKEAGSAKNTRKWVPAILYLASQVCTVIHRDFIFLVINTRSQIKWNLEHSPGANQSFSQHYVSMSMWLPRILSHFVWFCRNVKLIKPNQLMKWRSTWRIIPHQMQRCVVFFSNIKIIVIIVIVVVVIRVSLDLYYYIILLFSV